MEITPSFLKYYSNSDNLKNFKLMMTSSLDDRIELVLEKKKRVLITMPAHDFS